MAERESDPLFTFQEIAQKAGGDTTERQVKRWVDEGKLGCVWLPRGRRVPLSAWLAFVEARTTPAAASRIAQAERTGRVASAAKAREAKKPTSVRRPRRSTRKAVA